jgi:hypothetical protein
MFLQNKLNNNFKLKKYSLQLLILFHYAITHVSTKYFNYT